MKHKNHKKLHEPGHKAQLQEVWEEQDQMQQDFDPKTFFMLHDLDGNLLWDQVKNIQNPQNPATSNSEICRKRSRRFSSRSWTKCINRAPQKTT